MAAVKCKSVTAHLHTQIATMADSLTIGDADGFDTPLRPVLQDLVHHA